jgi:ribA/ribD-fused uncharacterized protein
MGGYYPMRRNNIYNVDTLTTELRKGGKLEYLFFWKPDSRKDGLIGKECLSQWWASSFEIEGVVYPTAEHFMMGEKARIFGDIETRKLILSTTNPEEVKKLGRKVKGFDETTWTLNRSDIVLQANMAKFSQNDSLRKYLMTTGEKILVEASPFDLIWGIGFTENDPRATKPEQWKGLNLLGFALMHVRSKFIESGKD